jgi:ABC-type Fe3+/spermidine/putrescine transport system ATPase subunit
MPGTAQRRGARVALAVRPEKISMHRGSILAEDGANRVDGVVESIVFLGESTTYLVRVGSDLFRAKRFDSVETHDITAGTPVTLTWLPRDTSAFVNERGPQGSSAAGNDPEVQDREMLELRA